MFKLTITGVGRALVGPSARVARASSFIQVSTSWIGEAALWGWVRGRRRADTLGPGRGAVDAHGYGGITYAFFEDPGVVICGDVLFKGVNKTMWEAGECTRGQRTQ